MGQRTQLVLKVTDRFGKTVNKVYHEQWGFGKTMPLIILQFLISLDYGAMGQRKYLDTFAKPSVKEYENAVKAGDSDKVKRILEQAEKTSATHLKLNSWDISDEYEDLFVYERTSKDGEKYYETLRKETFNGEAGIPLLEWNFADDDVKAVRTFTGDNNDGLALISIKETDTGSYDDNVDVKIGFLVSDYTTTRNNTSNIEDTEAINRFHDIYSYTHYYKEYCPNKVIKAIETLYQLFNVEQLGKDYGKQKATN